MPVLSLHTLSIYIKIAVFYYFVYTYGGLLEKAINSAGIKKKNMVREYIEAFTIAILLALFIRTFIIQAFKIPSGSMKSTLLIGDHLLVNKFIYGIKVPFTDRYIIQFKTPERGDVIVFKWPEDESKDFIKRVIGIEGDIIEIKDNTLTINNRKVGSRYLGKYSAINASQHDLYEEILDNARYSILNKKAGHEDYGPVTVPEDSLFVLGDNRNNSQDSRYWGFVKTNKVKGKAMIIYWSWPNWNRFLKIIK